MSQERALQVENTAPYDTGSYDWALDMMAGLDGVIDAVKPHEAAMEAEALSRHLAQLIDRFPRDYARLHDVNPLLFDADITAYGDRTASVFTRWEDEGGGPILPVFLVRAINHFDLPREGADIRAALMAAVLAEIPNDLLYHGNEHYRKVMFHTIRLLVTQLQGRFEVQPEPDKDDLVRMLIAATIHDLGHEGGDNLRDGIYTPGYMEQKAFDIMRPYLEALDLERDFWGDIEVMVFCTDITFIAEDNSPCVRMKKIYRHYFLHDLPPEDDVEAMMIGKLRRFEDNPRLALLAMLLHEADIATSSGLVYEQSRIETIRIMRERGLDNAGPEILLRFLTGQLGGRMMTPASQALFGARMAMIMEQAQENLQGGVTRF